MENDFKNEEYDYLVEHCRAIIGERIKNSREELIMAYAEVGEEIVKNPVYSKFNKGNKKFLDVLFQDIGIGQTNGYYCIKFYELLTGKNKKLDVSTAWKELKNTLKEGDNITWNKIKQVYLPIKKDGEIVDMSNCQHKDYYIIKVCRSCGYKEQVKKQHESI